MDAREFKEIVGMSVTDFDNLHGNRPRATYSRLENGSSRIPCEGLDIHHPLYKIYRGMIDRCYVETNQVYRLYGGRGIKVDARWFYSFKNFCDDMGPRSEGLTIERSDVNKGYSANNCSWETQMEQCQSKNKQPLRELQNIYFIKKSGKYQVKKIVYGKQYCLTLDTLQEAITYRDNINTDKP